jgi:hypothetical protein
VPLASLLVTAGIHLVGLITLVTWATASAPTAATRTTADPRTRTTAVVDLDQDPAFRPSLTAEILAPDFSYPADV